MTFLRLTMLTLTGLLAPVIAFADDVAYPPDARPCAIVSAFGGGKFRDDRADELWKSFSRHTQDALVARLERGGYSVQRLFTEHVHGRDDRHVALDAVDRTRCAKVIQLLLVVDEGGEAPRFGLDIAVLSYLRHDDNGVGVVKEWSTSYRYPRTAEGIASFNADDFAQTATTDLSLIHI